MMPVGHRTPLTVSGWKVSGVTPGAILRSKVSVWLGAPASRMKMTFLAVLRVVTPALQSSSARA